jgi:hypothetical protein
LTAEYEAREKIIQDFLGSFKRARRRGVRFKKIVVETVSAPSAISGFSHTFLAYSPAPLWQNQTGNEEIHPPNPVSDR